MSERKLEQKVINGRKVYRYEGDIGWQIDSGVDNG